jgi:hypothetical protein
VVPAKGAGPATAHAANEPLADRSPAISSNLIHRKHRRQDARKSWRDVLPVHPAADLFPLMSPDELRELGEDIKANGLREPIVMISEKGRWSVLDGRNRLDAMEAVGLPMPTPLVLPPRRAEAVRVYQGSYAIEHNLGDPYAYVLSANIHRRHLTAEQKREIIAKVLKANPEQSNLAIAKQVKADDKTVGKVRRELEARSEIPNVDARTDTKGRKQPAKKKRATVDDEMPSEEEAEESYQETLYDQACLLLDQIAGSTRQRFFAALKDKYPAAFAPAVDGGPTDSENGVCVHCGRPGGKLVLVAVPDGPPEGVPLHRECVDAWYALDIPEALRRAP